MLIHAHVVRLSSHSSSDDQTKYRCAAEIAEDHSNDPVRRLREELTGVGLLDSEQAIAIRDEVLAARRRRPVRRPCARRNPIPRR